MSTTPGPVAAVGLPGKPVRYESGRRSDTCEAAGDVRVQGRSQTIQVRPLEREWKVKPYCRKQDAYALSHVKEWTLRPLSSGAVLHCTVNSSVTAFVLSTGGFTGNLFHDYTDVLVPAFITARRFGGEVQFLVSSFKSWWTNRYVEIFQQLSKYEVIDIDNDDEVRCYPSVVVGPTFHKELGVDASQTPAGRGHPLARLLPATDRNRGGVSPALRVEFNSGSWRGGSPHPPEPIPEPIYYRGALHQRDDGDQRLRRQSQLADDLYCSGARSKTGRKEGCSTSRTSRGGSDRRGSSRKKTAQRRSSSEKKGLREEDDAEAGTTI
ncbi:xylan arabinosyl transferase [Hordeum vulgare]|nr:xylan arabinosyl transferase [Hordeum vulgare]